MNNFCKDLVGGLVKEPSRGKNRRLFSSLLGGVRPPEREEIKRGPLSVWALKKGML